MGTSPASFNATPRPLTTSGVPVGNIMDHVPMMNIAPFGLCQSPANPMVAAATAAAAGTLTPQPCIPATASPWSPGSPMVLIGGMPALNNSSTLSCMWSGTVSFADAGQAALTVP
ncbi:DUF4280 domain-containing protein [Sphaerotilus sp.]|uniref:DUF4280 domain-containing protein n=1 Tax=Sphaerotilus sp. TaxID=2093942 RepID=UPI00286DA835|nr:DUF4280 domain-containing protein [Sphaerotilus sp.]